MKRASKFLSVLLSLVMVFTLIPTTVFAASKPTITTQPKAVTAYVGTTASFKVVASDATSYLWQTRTSSTGTWKNTSFATSKTANLKVEATTARNGYQYRCKVTNSAGSVYTNAVTLTVSSKPVIKTQPKAVTATAGTTAKFSVVADGATSYLWQTRTSSTGSWKNTSFATSKTANLQVEATTARNGYQYRCKVTNAKGSTYTNAVTLTVKAAVPSITTQPVTQIVKSGTTATFTVKATGATSYLWQTRTSSTGSWVNTSFATSKTATLKVSATTSRSGYQYRCKVTNASGTTYTKTVYLYALGITANPENVAANEGTTAKFAVKATGHSKTYLWQTRTSSTGTWKNTSFETSKSATLEIPATLARNGYQYRCKVTDSKGNYVYSSAATLSVIPKAQDKVTITTQPTSTSVLEGGTAKFFVSATGSSDVTYLWQVKTSSTGSWKNTSFETSKTNSLEFPATLARDGYVYRCKITSGTATAYTNEVSLEVRPALTLTSQPTSVEVSVGEAATFTVEAESEAEITYQWQTRINSTGAWENCGVSSNTLTITPSSVTFNGYQYRCVVTANGVTKNSSIATLSVYGELTIDPPATEGGIYIEKHYVQVGESFTLNVTAAGGKGTYTYQWTRRGVDVGENSATLTETLAEEMLNSEGYVEYRCTVTDGSGNSATSAQIWVIKHANISIESITDSQLVDKDSMIQRFDVAVTGGNPEFITYQWQMSYDKSTWIDINDTNAVSGKDAFFVGSDSTTRPGQVSWLLCLAPYVTDTTKVQTNGGVWLRCIVTDEIKGTVLTSGVTAWSCPMTLTTSVSGTKCTVNVTGGLGEKEYSWMGEQGNWFGISNTSNYVTLNPSMYTKYRVTVTDAAGMTKIVEINSTTGAIE